MTFKSCIRSMRLRTLPLSLAGIALGSMLAMADFIINPLVIVFLVLTTVSLQVLSNTSNELGDNLSGTDGEQRAGKIYSLQTGDMTMEDLKKVIAGAIICSVVFGTLMIYFSFGTLLCKEALAFIALGAAAIWAAMKYTLGKNPYGYRAKGDFYVFIFFGLATVMGAYYLCARSFLGWTILLPASAIGLFSVAVLNVNNIRDMKTDAATRVTVALRMGGTKARIYQTALVAGGWACMIAYCLMRMNDPWHYLYVLTLPFFVWHLYGVWKKQDRELDPMLPLLVLSTFAFALLAGIGFVHFLF